MNALQAITAAGTRIIADTADFGGKRPFSQRAVLPRSDMTRADIRRFEPSEGTTNPSLILAAAKVPTYKHLFSRAKQYLAQASPEATGFELSRAVEYLAVDFGTEIWRLTGRVSTELDVTLSFDTQGTVDAALRIVTLYEANGVPKDGVRIKIAATWEGVQAAGVLEHQHGISVLITVVFGISQAKLAAEAGVTAIAPYVGRIGDWHKANGHTESDVGVQRVNAMRRLFARRGYKTQIMGASFRNVEQCKALAGTDMLTIAPTLLKELQAEKLIEPLQDSCKCLSNSNIDDDVDVSSESAFRWAYNNDACAVEKSADALRRFAADTEQLKMMLVDGIVVNQ